jgi:hypothetical protein
MGKLEEFDIDDMEYPKDTDHDACPECGKPKQVRSKRCKACFKEFQINSPRWKGMGNWKNVNTVLTPWGVLESRSRSDTNEIEVFYKGLYIFSVSKEGVRLYQGLSGSTYKTLSSAITDSIAYVGWEKLNDSAT